MDGLYGHKHGLQGFVQMRDKEFERLSSYIYNNYGIKVPIAKKILLESRLQKRLRALGLADFKEYLDKVLLDIEGEETIYMMDEVSTNKTDFFRENDHFEFLKKSVLPKWPKGKRMRIWSAATSSGEEAYTLAMAIQEFILSEEIVVLYEIIGTDISSGMLKKGVSGIYARERVSGLPDGLLKRYFLKSHDNRQVRVIREIRDKVMFARHNLMDNKYPGNHRFDVIFCRNVLIYFDRDTQREVISKLCDRLEPGGFLFLGHSESIFGMDLPLTQMAHTTYQKMYR